MNNKIVLYLGGNVMKEKTTVLIADDNQDFSQTLANYIQSQEIGRAHV